MLLHDIEGRVREAFVRDRTILTFNDYFKLMQDEPAQQLRNAAQYLKAVFDHFGTTPVQRPFGAQVRFNLFDAPWAQGEGKVCGQELVQMAVYKILSNFVRIGRVNKMILLHGPNGSAKSSFVSAVIAGSEAYAKLPQGAVYRFNWIFPKEKLGKSSLGFGQEGADKIATSDTSYAQLPPEMI